MRLWTTWIVAGMAVGTLAGAFFGELYMLAGAAIGVAAGGGIAVGLRAG